MTLKRHLEIRALTRAWLWTYRFHSWSIERNVTELAMSQAWVFHGHAESAGVALLLLKLPAPGKVNGFRDTWETFIKCWNEWLSQKNCLDLPFILAHSNGSHAHPNYDWFSQMIKLLKCFWTLHNGLIEQNLRFNLGFTSESRADTEYEARLLLSAKQLPRVQGRPCR